jgi:hypothetical protein
MMLQAVEGHNGGLTRRMRRMSASPSATTTSRSTTTTTLTKASRTTRESPKNASQSMKSQLLSAIHGARSWRTIKLSLRKSCTSNTRCTRSPSIRSLSASASTSHSMLSSPIKTASGTIRRTMMRDTSRGPKISKTQRTSST